MFIPRLLNLMSLILLSFTFLSAQITLPTQLASEKEKVQKELEKQVLKVLEDTVSEAETLKLANNRAIVYAIAGDLYWKFDEKRARELFRRSGNEILAANADAEKEKKESDGSDYEEFFDSTDVRNDVLPMIAKHDADLAIVLLAQTRPAKIAEALAKAAQPNAKQNNGMFNFNPDQYRVQREIALEQSFAVLAAEQNPDKAIKLIKDSLSKGISWNVLPLLQKLNKKDEKKAALLADDVVAKILDTDLTKKSDDLSAAIRFVQFSTDPNAPKNSKEKEFKFTDTQLRSIADKLVNTFMQPSNSLQMTMAMAQVMPGLEKLVPEKTPLLKQKQT